MVRVTAVVTVGGNTVIKADMLFICTDADRLFIGIDSLAPGDDTIAVNSFTCVRESEAGGQLLMLETDS